MVSRNISLTEQQAERIDRMVAAGRFADAGEYIRHLLQRDQEREQASRQLAAKLQEGSVSGDPIELTPEAIEELGRKMRAAARRAADDTKKQSA